MGAQRFAATPGGLGRGLNCRQITHDLALEWERVVGTRQEFERPTDIRSHGSRVQTPSRQAGRKGFAPYPQNGAQFGLLVTGNPSRLGGEPGPIPNDTRWTFPRARG